jgi:hypothetical protein
MSLPTIDNSHTMGSDNERQSGGLAPSGAAALALNPASRCASSDRGRPSSHWSALLPAATSPKSGLPASVAVAQRPLLGILKALRLYLSKKVIKVLPWQKVMVRAKREHAVFSSHVGIFYVRVMCRRVLAEATFPAFQPYTPA